MYADISKPTPPLPQPKPRELGPGLRLLPPLSRLGRGPGLLLLVANSTSSLTIDNGVPGLLIKWAEEGFAVVEIQAKAIAENEDVFHRALEGLKQCAECDYNGKVGMIAYDPELWKLASLSVSEISEVVGTVVYADEQDTPSSCSSSVPVLRHLASTSTKPRKRTQELTEYYYPNVKSFKFATPFHDHFDYTTEAVTHTRNLTFLKPKIGGPYFDLEAIWDEHTYYEFADRSVEHTMSTMVQEPYVNHVPTMTGGIGRNRLAEFYRDHFIFNNSADTVLELISRTIGIDRVVDEFIYKFTHDQRIDWLQVPPSAPGIPPTNLKIEIPFTAVVNIRGDRLYHEHIAWDQSSVLRQLGLLPEYLPYPHTLPEGYEFPQGASIEYRVPAAGVDTAKKMRDRNSVESNEMFSFRVRKSG
ncbi:hypothetical protein N7474_000252 [Penicillium riverlandense]|uniref:uncharacterized protein n=1 Tax=Penicillium riverlandense TaxID=1903569 RepID=UPI002548082A|nr:uncharacterized protein N7474_000252 [Penicillium riverlandense]KAJ5831941.1 hypothetical protein N7474_000252 [Penicillium riverlandense]